MVKSYACCSYCWICGVDGERSFILKRSEMKELVSKWRLLLSYLMSAMAGIIGALYGDQILSVLGL